MAEDSNTVLVRNRRCVLVKFPDGSTMRIGQTKRINKAFLNDIKIKQFLAKNYLVIVPEVPELPVNVVAKKEREDRAAHVVEVPVTKVEVPVTKVEVPVTKVEVPVTSVIVPVADIVVVPLDPVPVEPPHEVLVSAVEPAPVEPTVDWAQLSDGDPAEAETELDTDGDGIPDSQDPDPNSPPKKRRGRKPKNAQ